MLVWVVKSKNNYFLLIVFKWTLQKTISVHRSSKWLIISYTYVELSTLFQLRKNADKSWIVVWVFSIVLTWVFPSICCSSSLHLLRKNAIKWKNARQIFLFKTRFRCFFLFKATKAFLVVTKLLTFDKNNCLKIQVFSSSLKRVKN